MWFKNAQIYRLPRGYALTADALAAALAKFAFGQASDPSSAQNGASMENAGFIPPREGGALVHAVAGQFLIALQHETRLLPKSVVNQVVKAKAAELEEQQGFPPGKKARKELVERVTDELLPRAFPILKVIRAWIDPVNGWLVVDTPSPTRADDMVKALLKCVDRFPLESLRVMRSPAAMMTGWLEADEAPTGFTIDQDAELRATGESRAKISFVKHTLDPDKMRQHIAEGKQATRLAMTWQDRISFILTESLDIKRIAPLDVIKEGVSTTHSDDERFDSDMTLMTGELNRLFADLVEALGGEDDAQSDLVREDAKSA